MSRGELTPALARLFAGGLSYDVGGVRVLMDQAHVVALVYDDEEVRHAMRYGVRTQKVPGYSRPMPPIRKMNGEPVVVNLEYLLGILEAMKAMGARTVCIRSGATYAEPSSGRTTPLLMEIIPFMDDEKYECVSCRRARFLLANVTPYGFGRWLTEANGEYPRWSRGAYGTDAVTADWFRRMDGDGRDG